MDSGNRGSLGADVSAAEYVAGIAAYFDDFVRFNLKLEPAGSLTEPPVTSPVMYLTSKFLFHSLRVEELGLLALAAASI
jgi:hypothetical protein